ncbi:MAG: methyltransferase domain-containing protein [Candidatus Uhrbacteria bacterium]
MEISENQAHTSCPLDGSSARFWIRVDGYQIHRCTKCGFGFVYPTPDVSKQLYGEDYFFGSTQGFGYVDYDSDKQAMAGELRRICRTLASRLGKVGTLLDVGAATGYFVELASQEGWDAEGIELSEEAVRVGQQKGRRLATGTIDSIEGEARFDTITLLDVLEHIPDPVAAVREAYRLLKPGGILLVNVPDFGSVFARLMSSRWQAIVPPEHLSYFTRSSLRIAFGSVGFECVEFYKPIKTFRLRYIISMLSRQKTWKFLRHVQPWLEHSWIGKWILPVPVFDNLQAVGRKPASQQTHQALCPPTKKSRWLPIATLFGVITFIFLVPIVNVRWIAGTNWRGVVPTVVDDDVYYYARVHEILDGHSLIGNPYFYEHRDEISPAFFGADWLASPPYYFFSFAVAAAWNILFWSLVTTLLAYWLLRRLGASPWWAVLGAIVVDLTSYGVLVRPTSMQVVLPALLCYWLALHAWIRKPTLRSMVWLVIATAFQFYIYSYLWLVAGGTFIALGAFFVFSRRWRDIISLFYCGFASLILAGPALWMSRLQLSNPWYWETMLRIGLVKTHFPPFLAFTLSAWIIAVCLLWSIFYVQAKKDHVERRKEVVIFLFAAGLGLVVVMLSPIVSGQELATANHLFRFAAPWGVILLAVLASQYHAIGPRWARMSGVLRLLAMSLVFVAISYPLSDFWAIPAFALIPALETRKHISEVQTYAAPAAWLESQATSTTVVLANSLFSDFVPILTRHYVLFNSFGTLHLLSTREAEDRYLVANIFHSPDVVSLAAQYRAYGGTGNAIDQPMTRNREVRICRLFHLSWFGIDCGSTVSDVVAWKGAEYFVSLEQRYKMEIAPDILGALHRLNVGYLVRDKQRDEAWDMSKIPTAIKQYDDGKFEIYQISP